MEILTIIAIITLISICIYLISEIKLLQKNNHIILKKIDCLECDFRTLQVEKEELQNTIENLEICHKNLSKTYSNTLKRCDNLESKIS